MSGRLPSSSTGSSQGGPFSSSAFTLLWSGALVSNLGTWMERITVGIFVAQTTGQAGWTGTLAALLFLPSTVVLPLGGMLADRLPRRRYLLWVTALQTLIAWVLTLCALTGRLSLPVLALLVALTGCATALMSPAFQSLLTESVPPEQLTRALSLNSAQFNVARIVGPMLAAAAIETGGVPLSFALNTVSFAGLFFALFRLSNAPAPRRSTPLPLWEGLVQGARAVRADAGLRSALRLTFLIGFLVAPFIGLTPAFALHVLGATSADASLLTTFQGVGAVLGALLASVWADRLGRDAWLKVASYLLGPMAIFYWLAPSVRWAGLLILLLGGTYLASLNSLSSTCFGRAPSELKGRVTSLYGMLLDGGYAVGLMAQGWLGDGMGLRATGVSACVLFLVLLWVLHRRRPRLFAEMERTAPSSVELWREGEGGAA